MRSKRSIAAAMLTAVALVTAAVTLVFASSPVNVTPLLINRATFSTFKVAGYPDNGGLLKLEAKDSVDVVVRQHTYAPGGSTGWHSHPYPVLITVKEGTLTFYHADDPTCAPTVVGPGQGYVDDGKGHIARNEGSVQAVDVSVIFAPVGAPFRSELQAPNPYCGF